MVKQSQIKYDSKGNLVDVRSQRGIQLYQSWQAGNRQRNTELHEYERMKAYYAGKGVDAPYSTLAAFRRARRAQSGNYLDSRKEWAGQLEKQEKAVVVSIQSKKEESDPKQEENTEAPLTSSDNSGIIEQQAVNKSRTDGLAPLIIANKQFGKKNKKHMKEFGLDVQNADDREKYKEMIMTFRDLYDEVRTGEWAGQEGEILFFIKGEDVLLTKQNGEFITLFKGGINNARIKNARKL